MERIKGVVIPLKTPINGCEKLKKRRRALEEENP